MVRKTVMLALVVCLFVLAACVPAPVTGEPVASESVASEPLTSEPVVSKTVAVEPSVLESSVAVDFPGSITFSIAAESDTDIADIRLHYHVERMEYAEVTSEIYLEFEPAETVSEQWVWDMRKTGGLPPGSSLTYWWTVTDGDGDRVETDPTGVLIEDKRYDWRSLTEGKVTLYWYRGDDAFAEELMAAVGEALIRLSSDAGAVPEKPVKIYIYGNAEDLRGSLIFPQEWTGGVAFTQYGIIAIGIAPGSLDWGKRTIAHELTHLVVHQITFSPYSYLPTWLDEGLAQNTEGEMQPGFALTLDDAIAGGYLISVRSLSSPFSAYTDESLLAYAQSHSIVTYLIDTYGREKMSELLETFRRGSSYDGALEGVYGFDMDGLDALWREYVGAAPRL